MMGISAPASPNGASWLITQGGTGHGTHLGNFTWTSTHCTLLTSLTPPDAQIYGGRLEFHAADGDILYEDYVAVGGLVLEGDEVCADTAATFDGGTGRFENAVGTALERGCWPASTPGPVLEELAISTVGTIGY